MKALIEFKAFYFFGSVSVQFWCVCEMALTVGFLLLWDSVVCTVESLSFFIAFFIH